MMTPAASRGDAGAPFDPADSESWIARGRPAHHAAALAEAWRAFPDLPPDAPLEVRMARTRARVVALRPLHDAMAAETERARRDGNFAFVEHRLDRGDSDPRLPAILRGRDDHRLDWDEAVQFADGDYAARAGWDAHPPVSSGASAASTRLADAYLLGFREEGGRPDDPFDTARRSFSASVPAPVAGSVIKAARPLPSQWPKPDDRPRPISWSRRLLIVGAREAESAEIGLLSMFEACQGHSQCLLLLAGPQRGFTARDEVGQTVDYAPDAALAAHLAVREIEDILVAADETDLTFIDAHAGLLPLARCMQRTHNSALQQRAQFKIWLARGKLPGDMPAAGHIRWSKLAQGLSGRLGDFTARYEGSALPRGHRIVVRHRDAPATGYRTARGEPLQHEIIIANRSRLRDAMARALRQFAAALQFP